MCLERLKLILFLTTGLALQPVLTAAPNKGLTLADYAIAEAMGKPAYLGILSRWPSRDQKHLVLVVADSFLPSDDPYADAAWWSPQGKVALFLQSDDRTNLVLLGVTANPRDGCVLSAELLSEIEVMLTCSAGIQSPVHRLQWSLDLERVQASLAALPSSNAK